MIHHSRLRHNLVRLVVAYLRGRKVSCLYQQHYSPWRHGRVKVSQGPFISPALYNHCVSDNPITDSDMTSYADDFTLLASAPSIVEAEARCGKLVEVSFGWLLATKASLISSESMLVPADNDTIFLYECKGWCKKRLYFS